MQPMITIRASRIESIFFIQNPFLSLSGHDLPCIYENVGSVTRPESTIHSIFKAKHQTKKRLPFPKSRRSESLYNPKKYNKQGTIQAHRASRFLRKLCTKAFSRFPGLRIKDRLRLLMPCGTMDLSSISPRSQ